MLERGTLSFAMPTGMVTTPPISFTKPSVFSDRDVVLGGVVQRALDATFGPGKAFSKGAHIEFADPALKVHPPTMTVDDRNFVGGHIYSKGLEESTTSDEVESIILPNTNKQVDWQAAALSPDKNTLAVSTGVIQEGKIQLWQVSPQKLKGNLEIRAGGRNLLIGSIAYSPDGRLMAVEYGDEAGNGVQIFDAKSGKALVNMRAPGDDTILSTAFARDSKTLAVGKNSDVVELWDVSRLAYDKNEQFRNWIPDSPELRATLEIRAKGLSFSPDGKTLATIYDEQPVSLWNLATHQLVLTLPAGRSSLSAITFTSDGKTLIAANVLDSLILWRAPRD